MNPFRKAAVYVDDFFAGYLCETAGGFSFCYDKAYLEKEYASTVSLTLPLQKEVFVSATLFPFFDGLIPEGWLLKVVIDNWKLNRHDRFGILLAACRDCIGNVSIKEVVE